MCAQTSLDCASQRPEALRLLYEATGRKVPASLLLQTQQSQQQQQQLLQMLQPLANGA